MRATTLTSNQSSEMISHTWPLGRRRAVRSLATGVLALAILGPVAACNPNDVLSVSDIDVARPTSVADSSAIPAVLGGALGDFAWAYNGGNDFNQITLAGTLSDEMINTETFPTRIEVDARRQQYQNNGSLSALFYDTQRARASADRAEETFAQFLPKDIGYAEALNLSALTIVIMAENYCGAVPLSTQTANGDFQYGKALSTQELLQLAIAKADSALAIVANASATNAFSVSTAAIQKNLASVIKGRALLDNGDAAGAATAVAGVPSNFVFAYAHSVTTTRQNNGTWGVTWNVGRFGVAQVEGGNGLTYQADGDVAGPTPDPRVRNELTPKNGGVGFDGVTTQYVPFKYGARDAQVVIADGVEARLIEAEAALKGGDYPGALTILNNLRSDATVLAVRGYASALPPLTPAVGATAQQDQLFKERAYWLYLTSHRLGDLRRLITQYGRGAETVFPTGQYFKSGDYGKDVNTPIPQAEDNNPNFTRASCDVTKA